MNDREIEDWILVSLLPVSTRTGENISNLPLKILSNESLNFGDFFRVVKKLENEKLIGHALFVAGNYCLTKEGVKEADKRLNKLRTDRYQFYRKLMESVPLIDTKQRLKDIEGFIIFTFFTLLMVKQVSINLKNNFDVILPSIITAVFGIYAIKHFSYVGLSVMDEYSKKINKLNELVIKYKPILYKYKDRIGYIFFAIVLLTSIFLIKKYTGWNWKYINGTIGMGIIIAGIILLISSSFNWYREKYIKSKEASQK